MSSIKKGYIKAITTYQYVHDHGLHALEAFEFSLVEQSTLDQKLNMKYYIYFRMNCSETCLWY